MATPPLGDRLDFHLAWKRVKGDCKASFRRNFIIHPYEIDLIESDLEPWLENIREEINTGRYQPSDVLICDVPKGKGAIRPGAHLILRDRVVYVACLGACFKTIYKELAWPVEPVDFSYRLRSNENHPDWILPPFDGWIEFDKRTIEKINQGYDYIVFADVAGYYENIDLSTLMSDLAQIRIDSEVKRLLGTCLGRWQLSNGRGIPQGQSPSDILGKLYLDRIDRKLRSKGRLHYRYVDDYRILCRTKIEAKQALVDLATLLRHRGLCLQTAKLRILEGEAARNSVEGFRPILEGIQKRFVIKVREQFHVSGPSITITTAQADRAVHIGERTGCQDDEHPIELIRDAYKRYFIKAEGDDFDKSLFHFLLNRLSKQEDQFAATHCISFLEAHPQETDYILRYLVSVNALDASESALLDYLESSESVYHYQVYLIMEAIANSIQKVDERAVVLARKYAFDMAAPPYLRSVCRKILGDHGSIADLERIMESYASITDELERSEVIIAIRRLEKTRRNSFVGRVARDNDFTLRAERLIKNLPLKGRSSSENELSPSILDHIEASSVFGDGNQ